MAPPNKRKRGLLRVDAAIDAMAGYGFDRAADVRRVVRQLLKEYGGSEGWPFIEEFSYKVLLEAMLQDQEEEAEFQVTEKDEPGVGTSGNEPNVKIEDEEPACDDLASPVYSEAERISREGRDKGFQPKQSSYGETLDEASHVGDSVPSYAMVITTPTIRPLESKPCYGWIESDDEEADLVFLEPALEYRRRR